MNQVKSRTDNLGLFDISVVRSYGRGSFSIQLRVQESWSRIPGSGLEQVFELIILVDTHSQVPARNSSAESKNSRFEIIKH